MRNKKYEFIQQKLLDGKVVSYLENFYFSPDFSYDNEFKKKRIFLIKETKEGFSLIKILFNENDSIYKSFSISYGLSKNKLFFINEHFPGGIESFLKEYNDKHSQKEFKNSLDSVFNFLYKKFGDNNEEGLEIEEELEDDKEVEYPLLLEDKIQGVIIREVGNLDKEPDDFVKSIHLIVMKDTLNNYDERVISFVEKLEKEGKTNKEIKEIIMKYINKK